MTGTFNVTQVEGEDNIVTFSHYPTGTIMSKKITITINAQNEGEVVLRASASKNGIIKYVDIPVSVGSVAASEVIVTGNSNIVSKGSTLQLQGSVNPSTATYNTISSWRSINTDVATVDNNGLVTALKSGTTYIYAKNGENVESDPYEVTVTSVPTELNLNVYDEDDNKTTVSTTGTTGITGSGTIYLGSDDESIYLEGELAAQGVNTEEDLTNVEGEKLRESDIEWSSSNTSVATVRKGAIDGKSNGTAVITARINFGTEENPQYLETKYNVTVKTLISEVSLTCQGEEIDGAEIVVGPEISKNLGVLIEPNTSENVQVTWSSNNSAVTVDENGKITGVTPGGTATITAEVKQMNGEQQYGETITKSVNVKVEQKLNSIQLAKNTVYVKTNERYSIDDLFSWTVNPSIGLVIDEENLEFDTEETDIIVYNGEITATQDGINVITIFFKTNGGQIEDVNATIIATEGLTTATIEDATLQVGGTKTLQTNLSTDQYKSITWESDDTSVATIDRNTGKVTAVSAGETTITAYIEGNLEEEIEATCKVTVTKTATDPGEDPGDEPGSGSGGSSSGSNDSGSGSNSNGSDSDGSSSGGTTAVKTDTTTADVEETKELTTLPYTGRGMGVIFATIASAVTAVISWFKSRREK